MDAYNEALQKYHKSLVKEGLIKSLIWGGIIGFSVMAALAWAFYFADVAPVWLAPGIGFALLLAATAAFYFAKYRPTKRQVAERTDLLGLKERVITMVEMEGDTSYIAQRQREDTALALKNLGGRKIKLQIMAIPLIIVCLLAAFGVSGVTVSALRAEGAVPGPDELFPGAGEEAALVEVMYMEEDGGHIEGELVQIVSEGGDCSEVVAVADDGYVFDIWSDGVTTPARTDTDVVQSMTVVVQFIRLEDEGSSGEMTDSMEGSGHIDAEGQMPDGGGAGGKYEEYNQVIDGETYYRDVFEEYYERAMQILNEGGVVPEELLIIIQNYFEAIQ